jgi:hypothetical protein
LSDLTLDFPQILCYPIVNKWRKEMIIKEIVGTTEIEVGNTGVKFSNSSGSVFIPVAHWSYIEAKVDLMGKIILENAPEKPIPYHDKNKA